MPASRDYADHVAEQLAPLGEVKVRAMFGGHSLSIDGLTFALIAEDVLYLKADGGNRPAFEAEGLKPFAPFEDEPHKTMSYYPPPDTAFDEPDELLRWARTALEAALRARAKKKPRRAKSPAA
ncbi:MAG TPA: TfoX/Sxy family protein [Azospirillaceae bacterium]|nr:TfoX/Sxy family protein [Azospirillaceae bacterium]